MGKWNSTKEIWALLIVIIIVMLAAFALYARSGPAAGTTASSASQTPTRTAAPVDVVVPNEGNTGVTAGTAVPAVQVPAAPNSAASFRSFSIQVSNNAYNPSTVVVNQGDTVNLKIVAVDANYGFNQPDYGLSSAIVQGKTQTIQFQATQSGDFTFYCAACGGPAKGPVGHIIVTASSL
jgi:heme/copper-type cytochrome/quinol oxidase subunit 2